MHRENKLQELKEACGQFQKYPDLQSLVFTLIHRLEIVITTFEEQKIIITERIKITKKILEEIKEQKVKAETPDASLDTLDSTSMPIEEVPVHTEVKVINEEFIVKESAPKPVATIETQTGRSLSSPVEEPLTKDFTVTYNQPVDAQIQTQMSRPSSEAEQTQQKETITISKRTSGGQETIQIATRPMTEPQPIIEEPDDVLVEANYRKRPESETRHTELNISNVAPNQAFETVFVEPDETTTEVIVDADGSKRVIVRKFHRTVVRHQESSQHQQFSTLSALTEDGVPVTQSFSQITLTGQQSATSVAKGDGSKATVTSQQYGGKVISGASGGEINVQEYETEPETHYTVTGPTFRQEEVDIQGIKLHEGDITFINDQNNQLIPADQTQIALEGNQIHTSSSSVRAVVQQVTRRIIRKTRRIIRRTVIIDGKEHVQEEVIEEPEEIEVTEEGIPRVSINVVRTEDGQIIQQQQFGEKPSYSQQEVTVTGKVPKTTTTSDGKPIETVPVVTEPEERYVIEQSTAPQPISAQPVEIDTEKPLEIVELVTEKPSNIAKDFLVAERLAHSEVVSSQIIAPKVDTAPKDSKDKNTPDDESLKESKTKEIISFNIEEQLPIEAEETSPDNVTAKISPVETIVSTIITPVEQKTISVSENVVESSTTQRSAVQAVESSVRSPTESQVKSSTEEIIVGIGTSTISPEKIVLPSTTSPIEPTTIVESSTKIISPHRAVVSSAPTSSEQKTVTTSTSENIIQISSELPAVTEVPLDDISSDVKTESPKTTDETNKVANTEIVTKPESLEVKTTEEIITDNLHSKVAITEIETKPDEPLEVKITEEIITDDLHSPSAPHLEDITDTGLLERQLSAQFLVSEQLQHLPDATKSPKSKKKREFGKTKKVSGTPRSQSPLQTEEELSSCTESLPIEITKVSLEKSPELTSEKHIIAKTEAVSIVEPTTKISEEKLPFVETTKIQETEHVTSIMTGPSGDVEIVLSIEETHPEISISQKPPHIVQESKITVGDSVTEFLENEKKSLPEIIKEEKDKIPTKTPQEIVLTPEVKSPVIETAITVVKSTKTEPETPVYVPTLVAATAENVKKIEPPQEVEIVLSLEEKLEDSTIATPKVSLTMKIEENADTSKPSDVLQKDIHVQLPSITKTEYFDVPKLEVEQTEPTTPSDIDHGGRRSKKKKKHKDSKTPTPQEIKEDIVVSVETEPKQELEEEKPESVITSLAESVVTSLAESVDILIADDSVKSEDTPKPTIEIFGSVTESDDDESLKGKETGYEADKTVEESHDDDQQKKQRRKKKRKQKVKVKESEESNIPISVYESSVDISEPFSDEEPTKVEKIEPEVSKKSKKRKKNKRKQSETETEEPIESEPTIFEAKDDEIVSPADSYHTVSTPSEPGTVKIIEEKVISRPQSESPKEITSKIVTLVPVLEAVMIQEDAVQTSPIKDLTSEFLDNERTTVPEKLPEVVTEQVSVQTSPEIPKEIAETYIQTSDEEKEVIIKPEISETSTQVDILTTEIVTQTTPKSESPEEKVIKENAEISTQTATPEKVEITEESVQTITPEPVEIVRSDSAMQTKIESKEEFAQTKSPEKIETAEIASQVQPEIKESSFQTSPEPEPSAPPMEQPIETKPITKIETTEIVTQTSPVIIREVGELMTPSPSPTPTSSEQYEVHIKASILVPSDVSESISEIEPIQIQNDLILKPAQAVEDKLQNLEPKVETSPLESIEKSESITSDNEEYDVQVTVDGVPIDRHSVVTSFLDSERDGESPTKPKRKKHKKSKKSQAEAPEKDLFSEFKRQNTVEESSISKDTYADIARRSRSPSPVKWPKKPVIIQEPEEVKFDKIEEDKPIKGSSNLTSEVKETAVVSKVFTDIDEETVKHITSKPKKPAASELDQQTTTVDISINLPQESPDRSEVQFISKDTYTVVEKDVPREFATSFIVDSILTESEVKTDTAESNIKDTLLVKSDISVKPTSVTSTVDFLHSERTSQDGDDTVFINDKPVSLPPTPEPPIEELAKPDSISQPTVDKPTKSEPIVEEPLDDLVKSEIQKRKPVLTKGKGKGKHVSSVTIEEVQSPRIVADTPLTPASDSAPLSPPEYRVKSWQEPQHFPTSLIQSEIQQSPLGLADINVKWNQAQALERFKNLQNARKTTHLSDVLYLATLNEVITDETIQQRDQNIQQNLVALQQAVERRDVVVIQQTVITTVETITTWLETIEYRIYLSRQQTLEGPSEARVHEFNELKQEIANIESKVGQLQSVVKQTDDIYNDDERQRIKSYIDSLQQQVKVIEEVTEENEQIAAEDLKRWNEFLEEVSSVSHLIRQIQRQLSDLKESDAAPQTKLNELEKLENNNRANMAEVVNLIASAKGLMRDFPTKEIPRDVYLNNELTKQMEQHITTEREKAYQFLSLADEYEQTLKEFSQIILIAEALVESPVSVRNLEHLEDEMQNHRKFFVNLSHCRAILESLEENLDSETRTIHSELHQNLYERASVILDKSTGRFQIMSLAASRWTVLEQSTRDEMRWLQVAQQRVPDLNNVTSSDYERYIDLHNSLAADIDYHHAKLTHLNCVAQKLQDLVSCSDLEETYTESLTIIQKLQEDVQVNLERLQAFKDSWKMYNMLSDKVEYWLREAEIELNTIEVPAGPRGHLRRFWELKAQHEVHNAARINASSALDKSLQIVPISDEMYQRANNSELNAQWHRISKQIHDLEASILDTISAPDVPVNEKLLFLEQELQDLNTDVNNLKGIIKTEEELSLYVERLQIMSTRIETIQNELSRLGLLSASESEKVGSLLALSKRLEITIAEELEGGLLIKEQLQAIHKSIERVRRKHSDMSKKLDLCESAEKLGSDAVEKSINECYEIGEELVTLWQDLMSIRQLLHTLPTRLKVTVSPLTVERDISKLQDDHTALEKRCGDILALLRSRLALWKRFERQLELVQQSVQEADFMVELLTVQGTVDYERLRKATERLEVSDQFYLV